MGTNDEQADFPVIFACARQGWCTLNLDDVPALLSGEKKSTLEPLFKAVLDTIPPPRVETETPGFRMRVANLAYSDYVGRLAIGRVSSGQVKRAQKIFRRGVDEQGKEVKQSFAVTRLYTYEGLSQVEVETLEAGDIGVLAGNEAVEIGDSLCGDENLAALPRISVERPTLGMISSIPLAFRTEGRPFSPQTQRAPDS